MTTGDLEHASSEDSCYETVLKYTTREMVSFELGKEIEKDAFSSCHERRTNKKF